MISAIAMAWKNWEHWQHNMFPIALDLSQVSLLLIGQGPAFDRRKAQLIEAGATRILCRESLNEYDIEHVAVVMVAGLDYAVSSHIAASVREAGKLVNVEDVNDLCDFYFTAHIRRGDLMIAVSTGGASPTLAKRIRDTIGAMFDEKWTGYTAMIKEFRTGLRAKGKTMPEVAAACEEFLDEKGWLKP